MSVGTGCPVVHVSATTAVGLPGITQELMFSKPQSGSSALPIPPVLQSG